MGFKSQPGLQGCSLASGTPGDFRSLPPSAWSTLHAKFAPDTRRSPCAKLGMKTTELESSAATVNGAMKECRMAQVLMLPSPHRNVMRQEMFDREGPPPSQGDCELVSDAATRENVEPELKRPSPPPLVISSPDSPSNSAALFSWPCSPDWSAIHFAVAEGPSTLSETYKESSPHQTDRSHFSKALLHGRQLLDGLKLPSSYQGLNSGSQKLKMMSGNAPRKHVQHGALFIKSKAKRALLKTRSGIAVMQAHFSATAERIAAVTVVDDDPGSERELSAEKVQKSVAEFLECLRDRVEDAQVSEKAQKGFAYVRQQAQKASVSISKRMSQTAEEEGWIGFANVFAWKLGKAGSERLDVSNRSKQLTEHEAHVQSDPQLVVDAWSKAL